MEVEIPIRQPRESISKYAVQEIQKEKAQQQPVAVKLNQKGEIKKPEDPKCGFFELFRFANGSDKCLIAIGVIAAICNGCIMPSFSLIFGNMIDSFGAEKTADDTVDSAKTQMFWFIGLGGASFICSWLQMHTFIITGERQAIRARKEYFNALLKQDISWFDSINPNMLATKVATETFALQGAIGEKVPTFIMTITMLIAGFAIAYITGWELALICTAALPVIAISSGIFTYTLQNQELMITGSYQQAGAVAEQCIGAIKTVKSLNGQEHEEKEFMKTLEIAYHLAIKYGFYTAFGLGLIWFVLIADYGLGFYFGSVFVGNGTHNAVNDRNYNVADVITIFFSIMMGGMSLGQATPCLKNFALGQTSGYQIFKILSQKPTISPSLEQGQKPANVRGQIVLKDVEFTYPQKADIQVLKKINITMQAGQKTALVGESGSGKSTIMQLLERFYDCDKGSVTIDGIDIKDYNLKYLRDNVGYVGQEPVLFADSIRNNLKYGKPDATEEQMIQALKDANAYEFVQHLEHKLDTFVGSAGSQLSGGQKQRLSIARAILKNPQILLLDEATSALDRKNEKEIQQTLDELSKNRTTIVVAHRLSTVQNSDKIIVIDRGVVAEFGTHNELVQKQGKYYALSQNQIQHDHQEDEKQAKIPDDELVQKQNEEYNKSHVSQDRNHSKINGSHKNISKVEQKSIIQEEKKEKKLIMNKLYKFNAKEKPLMFLGAIGSIVVGSSFPFVAIIMAKMMMTLGSVTVLSDDEFRDESNKWCAWFLYISIITFFATLLQYNCWNKVAQALTLRLRQVSFNKIINMEIKWFDIQENNAGTLSARLGSDTQLVNGLTSSIVNLQIANFGALASGLIIAFIHDWRTALCTLVGFPLIVLTGAIQAQFVAGFSESTDSGYKDSGNLVQESVCNIRTVVSFGNETTINQAFSSKLDEPLRLVKDKAIKAGIAFGASQFILFIVNGVLFYLGAVFMRAHGTEADNMFTALFAILNAGFGAGNNNQFMTDIGQANNAAKNLFKIIDSEDEIQKDRKNYPSQKSQAEIKGEIEFKDVSFQYESRNKKILNKVSFKINAGQKIAFVGPSGCGKSTIMQLLMRFYEPTEGKIYLDGVDIHDYDIKFLRSQFGVVSQEPTLFTGTIEENIKYNTIGATDEDMKRAADLSKASTFIESDLFEINKDDNDDKNNEQGEKQVGSGYKRKVGTRGGQLSGGQKQRIAIARAIIKNPKILLLDEATSALDSKNEEIVQQSLDNIMKGKTTLAVAHRISTIRDSNIIFVIEEGSIVEYGTYEQLVAKKGFFYRLERGDQH